MVNYKEDILNKKVKTGQYKNDSRKCPKSCTIKTSNKMLDLRSEISKFHEKENYSRA